MTSKELYTRMLELRPSKEEAQAFFTSAIQRLNPSANETDIAEYYEDLLAYYRYEPCSDKDRSYHTFEHVLDCIGIMKVAFEIFDDKFLGKLIKEKDKTFFTDLLALALFFHDAVYVTKPGWGLSEVDSAGLALEMLCYMGVPYDATLTIVSAVLATHHSRPNHAKELGALIRSIDLAAFAFPAEQFDISSQKVFEEYNTDRLSFCRGRKVFVESMLAKPKIYENLLFEKTFETAARENLNRHLQDLVSEISKLETGEPQ